MNDAMHIPELIRIATSPSLLLRAQHAAAALLLEATGEHYPTDACAITLYELLTMAGISVQESFLALQLGQFLEKRGWARVAVGSQQDGDVGSTCGTTPDHGDDHIYLVVRTMNRYENVVADNQAHVPHFRYVDGRDGKTPTTHFLRAPNA